MLKIGPGDVSGAGAAAGYNPPLLLLQGPLRAGGNAARPFNM